MQTITTIGLDIAKSVFQVHGVDSAGQVVIRRQLKRRNVLAFFQKLPCRARASGPCQWKVGVSKSSQRLQHVLFKQDIKFSKFPLARRLAKRKSSNPGRMGGLHWLCCYAGGS